MKGSTRRRINALNILQKLQRVELQSLSGEAQQLANRLRQLEARMNSLQGEIDGTESRVRSTLQAGSDLCLEEMRMSLDFLDNRERLKVNQQRQINFAQNRSDKLAERLTQSGLKVRGMEHLLQHRLDELQLELASRELATLDEAWLQRLGAEK
jgi:flagellar export protein FliJ